ncbi:protein preli-like [Homalodisca vitripennis]|uniref:protein preli-like n=1 Tax=Homalodisca vitripennis TaxID=197043 RepID=UPI001EEBF1C1|nr:protein preli-like [Homalodisca vitripennis]XP_046686042.1 protein preli-like [Homalodisca vitripennis]XP_046686047.1 protein preli-like [Homalodisca vitripennis]
MVRYSEWKDVLEHSWDQVAQAFWRRYPNPESVHVLSEDTLSREVRDGKLYTKRLFTKTNIPPKWAERIISSRVVKILEESVVDPKEKQITTYTRNIGYTKVMNIVEKVVYKVSDEDASLTVAERSAWVESKMFGLSRAIEAFGIDRFRKNTQKAVNGFSYVLNNMFPKTEVISQEDSVNSSSSVSGKEKLMDAAKKATHLAKTKAETIYASASYQPSQT